MNFYVRQYFFQLYNLFESFSAKQKFKQYSVLEMSHKFPEKCLDINQIPLHNYGWYNHITLIHYEQVKIILLTKFYLSHLQQQKKNNFL